MWEFLILFFAVFLGMLAEYKLEHFIEHEREKNYVRSLVRDVELDILSLERSHANRQLQISYFDSLGHLLQNGSEGRMGDFYFYARHITRPAPFQYHDRTIQQLKNSGLLRLIRSREAADSITIYDNEKISLLLIQLGAEAELRQYISHHLAGKIFDPVAWSGSTDSSGVIVRPPNNPSLFSTDPAILNEFAFKIVSMKGTLSLTNRYVKDATNSAKNLLAVLKKEYHLE